MINSFTGNYRFLSNFYPCNIYYCGINYPSTEHAYQATKTNSPEEKFKIAKLDTPGRAKRYGQLLKIREDWDQIKLKVMKDLLIIKFRDSMLKQKLLDTGNQELIEGNTWNDTFWGICYGKGKNNLGKLLMIIRDRIS